MWKNRVGRGELAVYSISKMSKMLNVSVDALRRWDNNKQLVANRKPSGHRFYTHEQYLEASGKIKYKCTGKDMDAIVDKTVMITGGTGSLGNALTRRLCDYAKKIIIYSRCELKQSNMQQKFADKTNIRYLIGDIRDKERLMRSMTGVDVCIHGATMKRIETCARNPLESVKSNVLGSMNMIDACIEHKVNKALMVSTDKAASPATLYGGTKFVSEQMFIGANNYTPNEDIMFTNVRYGNIYGSNGSIKHIFAKQAKEKGEITITHQEMTRFFMGLDSAVDLILFALNNCIGGEIFVAKMKAIGIMQFAESFFPDVPKRIIGLRASEKIHEELISETESRYVVDCDKYFKIVPANVSIPALGWDASYPQEKLMDPFVYTSDKVEELTKEDLEELEEDYDDKHS